MLSPQIANSIEDGFIARPELTIITDAGRLPIDTPDTCPCGSDYGESSRLPDEIVCLLLSRL